MLGIRATQHAVRDPRLQVEPTALNMMEYKTFRNNDQGFTLIEMMIVVGVMMILAAVVTPGLMNTITDINTRYSAVNISGLLQQARITAVRRNTFYSIQPVALPSGQTGYFVDINKNATYAAGDPMVSLGGRTTAQAGTGSGAPNESGFVAGLGFGLNTGAVPGTFSARGLPCAPAGNVCTPTPGQGFVYFLSRPGVLGNISWASVVVTPSGRVQVWTCDGAGNWIQR